MDHYAILAMQLRQLEMSNIGEAAVIGEAASAIEALRFRVKALEEALTPSARTKAALIGEFHETVQDPNPDYDEDDDSDDAEPEFIERRVPISWTTIKEIMTAIIDIADGRP